jgi:hypothetical protein
LAPLIGRSILISTEKYDDWGVAPKPLGALIGRPGSKKFPGASEGNGDLDRLQVRRWRI